MIWWRARREGQFMLREHFMQMVPQDPLDKDPLEEQRQP